MSGSSPGSRRVSAPPLLAIVAWGRGPARCVGLDPEGHRDRATPRRGAIFIAACALALLASCGGEAPGLHPVGDDGFEVATEEGEPHLRVDRSGVYVAGHGEPLLVFGAARLERGGASVDHAGLGALALGPNSASYPRGQLGQEWYELRDEQALEQGWWLAFPPGEREHGRLELVLDLGPDVEILSESDGSVEVVMREGHVTYSRPVARDASGASLTATLTTRGRAIVLSIDDSGAAYPIEIDPLIALSEYVLPLSTGRTLQYGYSVAIDGNSLFVGHPDVVRDTTNGLIEGVVHQYSRGTGTTWNYVRRIRISGTSASAAFGSAVDVHGDWLVVGAPYDTTYGRVYAIRLSGGFNANGVPYVVQTLLSPDSYLTFGQSVTLSGSRLAVGGSLMNKVYVYNRSVDTWTNTTAHQITGTGYFGISLALARNNANLLVVGAPTNSTNGRVFAYRWNGTSWGTASTIVPLASPSQQTQFGISVAVSGTANAEHVAIGCLAYSGTRAQLARTIYNGSSWGTPSTQISGSSNGYLSTTETFQYATDNRTPHVAIAPDSSSAGNDILLLGLPNGVSASDGSGTVYGSHIALPSGISAVQRTLPGSGSIIHRGRAVATDGATVAVGDEAASYGYILTHQIYWANGTSCSTGTQCASGYCVDGVCCNSTCGGGSLSDCQACSTAQGGAANGTCGARSAGTACGSGNFLPAAGSETWTGTGGTPTITTGQADPYGGTRAVSILDNDAVNYESARTDQVAYTSGSPVAGEIWIKRATGFFVAISVVFGGINNTDVLDVDPNTGNLAPRVGLFVSYEATEAVAGWWRVRFTHAGGSGSTINLRIHAAGGTTFPTPTGAATGAAIVYGPAIHSECDAPDICDGTSFICPELALPASTVCRDAIGGCDTADTCTGSSLTCPANAPSSAGTVCRAANPSLACDAAETCDGVAYTCPADAAAASGTVCRSAAGTCDQAETCDGASFTCPTDGFLASGIVCRGAAAGSCDREEKCSGSSAACPTDTPQPVGTPCGSDTGDPCDAPDVCDGSSFACPELASAAGTVCRDAVSGCDTVEKCSGSSITCPADAPPQAAGTVCRPAVPGGCDVEETCSGSSYTCPADVVRDAYTLCRAASATTPPAGSDCDVPEYCDGAAAACPADGGASRAACCVASEWADGDPCRSDSLCVDQVCTTRGCGDGWVEGTERCDDHDTLGGDACSPTCAPTAFVIAARADGIDAPASDGSVAIDSWGRALVVWSEESATATRIRARRYDKYGNDPATTEIASLPGPGWDAHPVVAALVDGWAIAWRQPTGSEISAIVAARVSAAGVSGAPIPVSDTAAISAEDPSIAALSDGTLIVTWTDSSDPTAPVVRYRWIVGDVASGTPVAIAPGAGGDAAVAAIGATAMVVWTEQPALGARPRVVARRLTRTSIVDATPLEIATNAMQPTISAGPSQFAIGWVGRQDDPDGDVFALVAPPTGAITATPAHVTPADDPDRPYAEVAPAILAYGTGWILAWELPTRGSARIAAGGGALLPPEHTATLAPALTGVLAADLSLAWTQRGTWVVWSAGYEPASGAARATWAFILPPSGAP